MTLRRRKVQRYWKVPHRLGANECLWAINALRVTRAGTYGKHDAPLKGCIGLILILSIMHYPATDGRLARLHSKTPPAKKLATLTTLYSCGRESAAEHNYHWVIPAGQITNTISEGAIDHEILATTFSWYLASEQQLWTKSEDASQRSSCIQRHTKYYSFSTVPPRLS